MEALRYHHQHRVKFLERAHQEKGSTTFHISLSLMYKDFLRDAKHGSVFLKTQLLRSKTYPRFLSLLMDTHISWKQAILPNIPTQISCQIKFHMSQWWQGERHIYKNNDLEKKKKQLLLSEVWEEKKGSSTWEYTTCTLIWQLSSSIWEEMKNTRNRKIKSRQEFVEEETLWMNRVITVW